MTTAPTRRQIFNINYRLKKKIIDNLAEVLIDIKISFIKLVSITTKSGFILSVVVEERNFFIILLLCVIMY